MIMHKDSPDTHAWMNEVDWDRRKKSPDEGQKKREPATSASRMPNGDPPGLMLWGEDNRDK